MVNENIIPQTETVAELKEKYEVPSYEEFMRTYQSDVDLNYDDLSGGDIGVKKGYGPCNKVGCSCSCNGIDECSCQLSLELVGYEKSYGNSDLQVGYSKGSVKGKLN